MAEPNTTGTVAAATGAVTIILTQLGIDPLSLAWGFAGGLVSQVGSESTSKWKSAAMMVGAALTAGALSSFLVYYIQTSFLSGCPLTELRVFVAFVVGVTWRKLIEAFQSGVPQLLSWLMSLKVKGGGDKSK